MVNFRLLSVCPFDRVSLDLSPSVSWLFIFAFQRASIVSARLYAHFPDYEEVHRDATGWFPGADST